MKKLKVKVISPVEVLKEAEVDSVLLPTTSGQIEILPGHMGLFTELTPGMVEVQDSNQVDEFFIFGGIARMDPTTNTLLVLVDQAGMPSEDLLKEVQEAIKAAKEKKVKTNVALSDLIKAEKQLRYLVLKGKK